MIDPTKGYREELLPLVSTRENKGICSLFVGVTEDDFEGFTLDRIYEFYDAPYAHLSLFVLPQIKATRMTEGHIGFDAQSYDFFLKLLREEVPIVVPDQVAL